MMEELIGKEISGYQVEACLGRGGQSIVYRAVDLRLGRTVALKFLSPQNAGDPTLPKRMIREARALSTLCHPNITRVHHVLEYNGLPLIVMEYIEGETLTRYLETKSLSIEGKLSLMRQITKAVAYAHSKGVLHRDLKPANILVTPGGETKLLDFGLAKFIEGASPSRREDVLTETGAVLGTVSYLSPEQAVGKKVDERSDLFSLGIIFYEMFSNHRPFDRETPIATLVAIVHQPPTLFPDPSKIPQGIQALILRLLEKLPEQRFQSALLLLERLDTIEPESTLTTALAPALPRRAWSSRLIYGLGMLAVLLFAISGGIWILRRDVPKSNAEPAAFLVIPVTSIADDRSRQLAEMITGEIVSALSRSHRMRVHYLPQMKRYDWQAVMMERLRNQSVRYQVEGNLLLDGDKLKITTLVTDLTGGTVLWTDNLQGQVADVYTLAARVSAKVAAVAGVTLDVDSTTYPGSEAFDLYLRGKVIIQRKEPTQLNEAVGHLKRCVEIAPDFTPAYLGLAEAARRSEELEAHFHNPSLAVYTDYFKTITAKTPYPRQDSTKVDLHRLGLFCRYLRQITQVYRGDVNALGDLPMPYSANYWLSDSTAAEVKWVKVNIRSILRSEFAPKGNSHRSPSKLHSE